MSFPCHVYMRNFTLMMRELKKGKIGEECCLVTRIKVCGREKKK